MANLIQEVVDELAATYNLDTSDPIFGSGGVPRTSPPPPAVSTPTPPDVPATAGPAARPPNPYAKCSRAKTKKKRRHCMKHVRMRQNALT